MKKLKLNLDELKVESFETNAKTSLNKGTVHGNVSGANPAATCLACSEENSCFATCVTCANTCGDTCAATCFYSCGVPTCDRPSQCGQPTCDAVPTCDYTTPGCC